MADPLNMDNKETGAWMMRIGISLFGYGLYKTDVARDAHLDTFRREIMSVCDTGLIDSEKFAKLTTSENFTRQIGWPQGLSQRVSNIFGPAGRHILTTVVGFSLAWHGVQLYHADDKEYTKTIGLISLADFLPTAVLTGRWLFTDIAKDLSPVPKLNFLTPLCDEARRLAPKDVKEQAPVPVSSDFAALPEPVGFKLPELVPSRSLPNEKENVADGLAATGFAYAMKLLFEAAKNAPTVAPVLESVAPAATAPAFIPTPVFIIVPVNIIEETIRRSDEIPSA